MSTRREQTSPIKQHILWTSSLRGMERPVRSFKSFIRTAPPNPGTQDNDKPLPPTPTSPIHVASLQRTPPNRAASITSWKPPAEWDDPSTSNPELQASPLFTTRKYDPLLPEPSPGVFDMLEPVPWPFKVIPAQHPRLEPIDERANDTPSPPFRHPSRVSPLQTPSAESDPGVFMFSNPNTPFASPAIDTPQSCSVPSLETNIHAAAPSPQSEFAMRISNLSTKQKAFASLGIESPGDRTPAREHWSGHSSRSQSRDDEHSGLSVRGKKLLPLSRGSPMLDDRPEDAEMNEKLQQLSVSQDYHNVLADQYHEACVHGSQHPLLKDDNKEVASAKHGPVSNNHELVPRPLSWRKDYEGSSHSSTNSKKLVVETPVLGRREGYRKMPSWVPLHQLTHKHIHKRPSLHGNESPRSASEPLVPTRRKASISEANRSPKKELHLIDLIPNVRGFKLNAKRARATSNRTARSGSPSIPFQATPPSMSPALEQPTPLFRLPGGLALVRQTPTPTQQPQPATFLDTSPTLGYPQPEFYDEFPGFDMCTRENRRSSRSSQDSHSPVRPSIAVNKRLRTSFGSLSSPQSRSSTPSPATSPLAQEIARPRTPPLPPKSSRTPNSPPTSSPLSHDSEPWKSHKRTDSAIEEDGVHKRGIHVGIFDKARDARDAWKRHQRDVKHEKLKSSIRVLGPTDPSVTSGYVKREGRSSGEDDIDGRMPGYMVTGPL